MQDRLLRWKDFLDPAGSTRRVLLAYGVQSALPPHLFWPENREARVHRMLDDYAESMRRAEWLYDDWIPHMNLISGTEIFAECFGCAVHRPADNMPFALPAVKDWTEAAKLRAPSLWDSPLRLHFEMADAVRAQEPDAILRLPDIQSPLDIAALIWDKRDFYIALVEQPGAVHQLCEAIFSLLTCFLDAWFEHYGRVQIAHYPEYPLFSGVSISEDEIGALSPALFEEFALPYLNRLSSRYGGIGIHCCANSRHQWEGFKRVEGLFLINLVQPVRELESAAPTFEHVAQWPMDRDAARLYALDAYRFVETIDVSGMDQTKAVELVAQWRATHCR